MYNSHCFQTFYSQISINLKPSIKSHLNFFLSSLRKRKALEFKKRKLFERNCWKTELNFSFYLEKNMEIDRILVIRIYEEFFFFDERNLKENVKKVMRFF